MSEEILNDKPQTMLGAMKRTGRDAIIYGVGQGVSKVFAFLLVPLYTRYLTAADFGRLGLLGSLNEIFCAVLTLGLISALFVSYYDYESEKDRRMVISTTLIMLFAMALVAVPVGFALFPTLSRNLFNDQTALPLLWLIVLKSVSLGFQGVPLAVYRARGQALLFVYLTAVSVLLRLGAIVYLVVVKKWGLMGVICGDAWTTVFMTAVMLWTIRRDIRPAFSLREAVKMLKFGLPIVPADMASMVFMRADLYFLKAYSGLHVVGQYNAAAMVINAFQSLVKTPLMLVWQPMLLSVQNEKFANRFYAHVALGTFALSGFLALSLAAFSPEVIRVIGGPGYEVAAQVLPILCLAQVLYITQITFTVGTILKRKTQYFLVILGAVCVVTLVSNMILVPRFGIFGAGLAGLVNAVVFAVLNYSVTQRFYRVSYDFARFSRLAAALLAGFTAASLAIFYLGAGLSLAARVLIIPASVWLLVVGRFLDEEEYLFARQKLRELLQRRTELNQQGLNRRHSDSE